MAVEIDKFGNLRSVDPQRAAENVAAALRKGTAPSPISRTKRRGGSSSSSRRRAEESARKAAEDAAKKAAEEKMKKLAQEQARKQILRESIIRKNLRLRAERARKTTKILKEISGISQRNLVKQQKNINQDVQKFNAQFGNRELTEEEIKRANKISSNLDKRQEELQKETERLKKAPTTKIKDFLFGKDEVEITDSQRKSIILQNNKLRAKISKNKSEGKGTKTLERNLNSNLETLRKGTVRLIATDVPITPVGAIGVGKPTKIKFIGKQVTEGNKIVTDIAFFTANGRRVGLARGVTIIRGEKGFTIAAGRSGVKGFKFPSAKPVVKRIRSFVSKEIGGTKASKFKLNTQLELLKEAKKTGKLNIIKENLDGLLNLGIGRTATVKGSKFIRGAKIKKRIDRNDFASMSAVFTKGDLSKIVGKTFTTKGAKADFIGVILGEKSVKGLSGLSGLSGGQKLQYQQALNKVISAAAASLSKTNKLKNIGDSAKLVAAAAISTATKPSVPLVSAEPRTAPKAAPKIEVKQEVVTVQTPTITKKIKKTKSRVRSRIVSLEKVVLEGKQALQPKAKISEKSKQRVRQKVKQAQKQLQKLKQAQKTIQKQQLKTTKITKFAVPKVLSLKPIVLPGLKKKKVKVSKKKKAPKRQQGYNSFARPIKKPGQKKRPKLVKINKVPLVEKNANDLTSFAVDTSLSRTGRIRKTTRKPKKPIIKVPSSYSVKNSKKFKKFRTVKGKRVPLKNVIIEKKGKALLDTRQERQGITLRKRIAQFKQVPKKKKVVKRKATPAQLRSLKKARAQLKKKKGGRK